MSDTPMFSAVRRSAPPAVRAQAGSSGAGRDCGVEGAAAGGEVEVGGGRGRDAGGVGERDTELLLQPVAGRPRERSR